MIWIAWSSSAGWILSLLELLNGQGYLAAAPFLYAGWFLWWKATAAAAKRTCLVLSKHWRFRTHGPLHLLFLGVAAGSLTGGLAYIPWSFDAVTYRLPRILYWWAENGWYWIGTLDHRLDYSSVGFEWQMLPLILATKTDRALFLLNWLPYLLLPGLIFSTFRTLGVSGRSARHWMWLLPTGYCFALQSGSVQNDGYSAVFVLSSVAFASTAFRTGRLSFWLLALLAAAALTGAKLSNLPLLLPLGVILLPALIRVRPLRWPTLAVVPLLILVSFLPLAAQALRYTGDWTGDPMDQWGFRARHPVGSIIANALLLLNDVLHPPVAVATGRINAVLQSFNNTDLPLLYWLKWSHPMFRGLGIGDLVYEGAAGLGFGLGLYSLLLLFGQFFQRSAPHPARSSQPVAWKLAPWLAWVAFAVLCAKLGSDQIARIAAPYYPMLLIPLVRRPRVAAFERRKTIRLAAFCAALSVFPILFLTPIRPLLPPAVLPTLLAAIGQTSLAANLTAKYRLWASFPDDLAPLRAALPAGETRVGYAGAFRDTCYGLWKPFGTRRWIELGLPIGSHTGPPADLHYAVVTEQGIKQRYSTDLATWLASFQGAVIYQHARDTSLEAGSGDQIDFWLLVEFSQPGGV